MQCPTAGTTSCTYSCNAEYLVSVPAALSPPTSCPRPCPCPCPCPVSQPLTASGRTASTGPGLLIEPQANGQYGEYDYQKADTTQDSYDGGYVAVGHHAISGYGKQEAEYYPRHGRESDYPTGSSSEPKPWDEPYGDYIQGKDACMHSSHACCHATG